MYDDFFFVDLIFEMVNTISFYSHLDMFANQSFFPLYIYIDLYASLCLDIINKYLYRIQRLL